MGTPERISESVKPRVVQYDGTWESAEYFNSEYSGVYYVAGDLYFGETISTSKEVKSGDWLIIEKDRVIGMIDDDDRDFDTKDDLIAEGYEGEI